MKLPLPSKLLKLSSVVMAARVAGAGLGLILQVFLARWLGAEQLANYVLAVATAGILSVICGLGFPSITARFISAYQAEDRLDLARGFIFSSRLHISSVSLAIGAIAIIAITSPIPFWTDETRLPIALGCAAAPFIGFMRLNGALANTFRYHLLSYLPDLLFRPLLLLICAATAAWLLPEPSLALILICLVGIVAILSGIQAVVLRKRTNRKLGNEGMEFATGEWRLSALPMTLVVVLTSFVTDLDVLLLALLLPKEDVAIFSVCLRLTMFVSFGIQAVYQLVLPDLADAYHKGDHGKIQRAVKRANLLNLAATGSVAVGAAVTGEWLLSWFGPEFVGGYWALIIVILAQLATAAAGPNSQLLNLAGEQKKMVLIYGSGLMLLVGLNGQFVPIWGLEGAAAAFVMASFFWITWLSWVVYRKLGYHGSVLAFLPSKPAAEPAG